MDEAIKLFLVLSALVGAGSVAYLAFGAVRIAVRRMERRAGLAAQQGGDSADLDARVAALEEATGRLAELEERVDFAERMLARQRETDRLEPGRR